MGFIKKLRDEARQKRAATDQIRKKSRAAYFRAKEKEAIKFAGKKAELEYKRKEAHIKSGGTFGAVRSAASSISSGASALSQPQQRSYTTRTIKKGKGKGKKVRVFKKVQKAQQPEPFKPFDIGGASSFNIDPFGSSKKKKQKSMGDLIKF